MTADTLCKCNTHEAAEMSPEQEHIVYDLLSHGYFRVKLEGKKIIMWEPIEEAKP